MLQKVEKKKLIYCISNKIFNFNIYLELQKEEKADVNTKDHSSKPANDVNKVVVIPLPEPGAFLNMVGAAIITSEHSILLYNVVRFFLFVV